jgi:hypothetical protein
MHKLTITAKSLPMATLRKLLKNNETGKIYFGENISI